MKKTIMITAISLLLVLTIGVNRDSSNTGSKVSHRDGIEIAASQKQGRNQIV